MVLTWNAEPSKAQSGCTALPAAHAPVLKFCDTGRFCRDGTNHPDRLPNYLNKADPQGLERHTRHAEGVDTNTHTSIQDRLASAKNVLEMAEHMEQMLWSPPAMKSERLKSATNKSLLSQDTRFETLKDSTPEDLGPGHYWIEGGRPDMGPLHAGSPSRGASPGLDPLRQSRPFMAPPRADLFTAPEVPDRVYRSPDFQPMNDTGVAWRAGASEPARAEVPDWRWQTRVKEGLRQVPQDLSYTYDHINQSSQLVKIADVAARSENPTHTFRTTQPRLARLPKERLADTRLSRPRSDEDPSALGPGSHTPLISLGAARRSTYRIFAPAGPVSKVGSSNAQPWTRRGSTPSSSFANTPRGRPAGPYSWNHDSTLTRVY